MDFKIQRFPFGHTYYTDKTITNTDEHKGVVGTFKSVFGQCVDNEGNFMHYTVERFDTLIEEGIYEYDLIYSPANKCIVPRLTKHNGIDISARMLEHHIANWVFQLKGCTSHGMKIDLVAPGLQQSGIAFGKLNEYIAGQTGTITYETLK